MIVRELIDRLKQEDPEATLALEIMDGTWAHPETVTVEEGIVVLSWGDPLEAE